MVQSEQGSSYFNLQAPSTPHVPLATRSCVPCFHLPSSIPPRCSPVLPTRNCPTNSSSVLSSSEDCRKDDWSELYGREEVRRISYARPSARMIAWTLTYHLVSSLRPCNLIETPPALGSKMQQAMRSERTSGRNASRFFERV